MSAFYFVQGDVKMSIVDLAKKKGFVLDGAMSYELEHQGVDTDNKL